MIIYKYGKLMSLILIFVLNACTLPSSQPTLQPTQQIPANTEAQDPLAGTQWSLVTFGSPGAEMSIVPDSHVTLQFGVEGGVSGNAGCNSFGGSYTLENQKLEFSQVVSTLMACVQEDVMQQERDYFNALNEAAAFEIINGNLQIMDDANQFVLNFVPFIDEINPTPETVTETIAPSETTVATSVATPSPTTTSDESSSLQPDYLDDRSTATGLMQSYFNAINRSEYLRAYSYWRDPAGTHGSFEEFQTGYEDTRNVTLQFGQIGDGVGAGQIYYSVPVLLTEQTTAGTTKSYAACYILHLSQPTFQEPPFRGLTIERGIATVIGSGVNANNALATACSGPDYPAGNPVNPLPVTNTSDISKDNYLDDRSDPVLVLSSLFNAINLHEYARAYGYWDAQSGGPNLPTYEDFKNGYANTKTVEFQAGEVFADAGAGQRYFSVPVVISAQLEDGTQQTFAGCYILHMSAAGIQATPPFSPLAIRSAQINQVVNTSDLSSIMPQNCQP